MGTVQDDDSTVKHPSQTITQGSDDNDATFCETDRDMSTSVGQDHVLRSMRPGDSEIEQLAHRVETKRANRIPVTFPVRLKFLETCRRIAREHDRTNKISMEELIKLRDSTKLEFKDQTNIFRQIGQQLGFRDNVAVLLSLYERGIESVNEVNGYWFHFQDFSYYHTRLESRWPWMRSNVTVALLLMFAFYFFTPILFCTIMRDQNICPEVPGKPYSGWITSLYYASSTMATVGYGDVTIDSETRWKVFVVILYMITALLIAIFAFAAAAEKAESSFTGLWAKLMDKLLGSLLEDKPGELLHRRVRIIKIFRLSEIISQFLLLNLVGVLVARIFIRTYDLPTPLSWMDTMYWAIQTTTTIGYGDLTSTDDFPFDFRWFQIFYLTFSTYFVGATFGRLAGLRSHLEDVRRHHAWNRREVSEAMIEDMQAYEHDDKIDQYEFTVATLLTLGKISSDDIVPIMNKFRRLAGAKGYIQMSRAENLDHGQQSDEQDMA